MGGRKAKIPSRAKMSLSGFTVGPPGGREPKRGRGRHAGHTPLACGIEIALKLHLDFQAAEGIRMQSVNAIRRRVVPGPRIDVCDVLRAYSRDRGEDRGIPRHILALRVP